MEKLIVIEWTYKLQHELDKMNNDQLNKFMEGKAIRYNGLLIVTGNEYAKQKRKNSQVKRKTSRTVKESSRESKSL
jgi:hypothetical protein